MGPQCFYYRSNVCRNIGPRCFYICGPTPIAIPDLSVQNCIRKPPEFFTCRTFLQISSPSVHFEVYDFNSQSPYMVTTTEPAKPVKHTYIFHRMFLFLYKCKILQFKRCRRNISWSIQKYCKTLSRIACWLTVSSCMLMSSVIQENWTSAGRLGLIYL